MVAPRTSLRSLNLTLSHSAAEIATRARALISAHHAAVKEALITTPNGASSDATAIPTTAGPDSRSPIGIADAVLDAEARTAVACVELVLPGLVGADADARLAATQAKTALCQLFNDLRSPFGSPPGPDGDAGIPEAAGALSAQELPYYLQKLHMRPGSSGEAATSAEEQQLSDRISELCGQFEHNVNKNQDVVLATREELRGMPESFLAGLEQRTGPDIKYELPLHPHVRLAVAKNCVVEKTRRALFEAGEKRCVEENTAIIEEIFRRRRELALLRGYSCHADWKLKSLPSMAGSFERALAFCEDVVAELRPLYEEQLQELEEFWREQVVARRSGGGGSQEGLRAEDVDVPLEDSYLDQSGDEALARHPLLTAPWNLARAFKLYDAHHFSVDGDKLKQHFPLRETIMKILDMYAELLELGAVREVPPTELALWHPSVFCFEIGPGSDRFILFDLFPRPGKYAHQCCYPLLPATSTCQPSCVYLGNLTPPPAAENEVDSVVLLRPEEVQTLFHEIGHCMHCICGGSSTSAARFVETPSAVRGQHPVRHYTDSWAWAIVPWHGRPGLVGVEQDFLEVPSRMFEQWIQHRPEVIVAVSSEANPISLADAERLVRAKNSLKAVSEMRYWAMALADLRLHGPEPKETSAEILQRYLAKTTGRRTFFDGANFVCSWYHMVQGYDAGYFGYGWSDVYAMDLFSHFRFDGKPGIDAEMGVKLREEVLAPCASRPARAMMAAFLGREDADLKGFLDSFRS